MSRIPGGRILRDSLKKGRLVFHHNRTPQGTVSCYLLGNISRDKRGASFLNPCITLGIECDNIEVGMALVGERGENSDGCVDSLH